MKGYACTFGAALFFLFSGIGLCQEDDVVQVHSRSGVVTQVDSIGSLLVVNCGNEDIRFNVDSDTKIQRGDDDIMLDDLESNDNVDVHYYRADDGSLKAVLINDDNIAASF